MFWLLLGAAALAIILLAADRLGRVSPRVLAQGVRWGSVAALAAASLMLLRSGRVAFLLLPALQRLIREALAAGPSRQSARARSSARGSDAAPPSTSVETKTLRMRLDHASGTVDGAVLSGRFRGRRLADLPVTDLVALLDICRREDADSVALLEAYLDRRDAAWREMAPSDTGASGSGAANSGPNAGPNAGPNRGMTRDEALGILGLGADPSAEDVRAAHHRLMKKLHPDQGGTNYLASKVNQAKDALLRE